MAKYLVLFATLSIFLCFAFCWVLLLFLTDYFKQKNIISLHRVLYMASVLPAVGEGIFVGHYLLKIGVDIYSVKGFLINCSITLIPFVIYKLFLKDRLINVKFI